MKSRKYTQAFPEQKKSSNPGVELGNALKIQVTDAGKILNTE